MRIKGRLFKSISLLVCLVLGISGIAGALPPAATAAAAAADIAVHLYQDLRITRKRALRQAALK
ncbi:hypothetical protein [Paenibacillus sp. GCM10027626]|uniref:hypothetical protein n=1 Tax=Paenibacillus sp. GCM10027626 TaxID=3273411 RepID=UPI00362E1497